MIALEQNCNTHLLFEKDKVNPLFQLAQLLPMEENFLLLFRFDNPLESSVEFMKLWHQYDTDNSGYIEADELKVY